MTRTLSARFTLDLLLANPPKFEGTRYDLGLENLVASAVYTHRSQSVYRSEVNTAEVYNLSADGIYHVKSQGALSYSPMNSTAIAGAFC